MNKNYTMLGIILTVSTILLQAADILDYLAVFIKNQNWVEPRQWDTDKIRAFVHTQKQYDPVYQQKLLDSLNELSADKKKLLIETFKSIALKNRALKEKDQPVRLTDKFELKKQKQFINSLLFIDNV